jgi:hypothetical protein
LKPKLHFQILMSLIVTAVVIFLLSTTVVLGQEAPDTPEPGGIDDAPYDPTLEATSQAVEDAYERELASRSIFDFHVAYLIAPNAIQPESLMSQESFAELFGAVPIASWEEFLEQDDLLPFQVVLVHESMYQDIDTTWTQEAYRNRIMIAGVGITFEQMVEITGDHCIANPYPHLAHKSSEMSLVFSYDVTIEDQAKREVVHEHELESCDENFSIEESFGIKHGVTHVPMTSRSFVEAIGYVFVVDSIDSGVVGNKKDLISLPEPNTAGSTK